MPCEATRHAYQSISQNQPSHAVKIAITARQCVTLMRPVTGGMRCWIAHKQLARLAKLKWMIDMNIKEAVERIEMLNKNITEQENLISIVKRDNPKDVWAIFSASKHIQKQMAINRSVLLHLIEANIQNNKVEIETLQPIVDMANAALKGVLS